MKCLAKTFAKEGIWLEDFDEPTYGNNDLLIKIRKTAICGTDVHIYNWDDWASRTIPVPMIVGHEFVGEVVAVGNDVDGFAVGDRVSGEGHLVCGHCRNCRAGKRHLCRNTVGVGVNRPGCFAELLSIPAGNAFILPNDIPDDIACVLDPLGNAAHTALSFDSVGEDVLITGAGPIGILAAAICRHVGARNVVITDVNEYRLNMAQKMGARCVNVSRHTLDEVMSDLGMVEGFDIGLEMSGSDAAFTDMIRHMNHGGRIALLGIPPGTSELDLKDIVFKGLVIKGIYGREMYETWYKMVAMLQSGLNINQIITHRYHVDDFADAFAVMRSGKSGKVILDWD